ncbi:MAG: VacJ family lipoprotein [Nitrospirae bacterium]|nr:VacJ family lipoprotein [Nitrospirota bacterium]
MPGISSARHATDHANHDHAGRGTVNPESLHELSSMPEASAQSYYVVNDTLYLLMQKPMAKAYGAFMMVPVVISDTALQGDRDVESAALSSGDTLHADATSTPDQQNEDLHAMDVALNMNFRGAADKPEEADSGLDSPRYNDDLADPLEPINRVFFTFNDKLYFWALKPVSRAYGFLLPAWGRARVRNVFDNIQAPVRLVNALLQFKLHKFGAEFARLVLNSTVGIAGLFDIAARHPELKTGEEDLGQTLGSYGLGEGFYLVLPFLGPSSLRDSAGMAGDYFIDPIGHITPMRDAIAVRTFDRVNDTSFKIGDYEDIKESAVDPYISIRDMYKQFRRSKIRE